VRRCALELREVSVLDAPTVARDAVSSIAAARRGYLVAVAGFVMASTALWGLAASAMTVPWIYPDELIYSEMGKSIASGELPGLREVGTLDYGVVYPLVLSPAWLWNDLETSYAVARWINAFVISLAAVPAFFLARRFTTSRAALLVSVFAVGVPSMAYAGTLMTEVAFYPATLCALLAICVALERPSRRNQLLALAVIGLAYATKPLAVALVPAYLGAVAVLAVAERDRARARSYTLSYALVGIAGICALVGGLVLKGDLAAALGAYAAVVHEADPLGAARWFLGNLAGLALYVGAVPLTATVAVVVVAFRRGDERRRVFAALVLTTTVSIVLAVAVTGAYVSEPGVGGSRLTPLSDRNLFVVAPLLLLGLVLWMEDRRRTSRTLVGALAATVGLVALYPWESTPRAANPQNVASLPYVGLLSSPSGRVLASTIVVGLLGCLMIFTPWDRMGRLWIGLGLVFGLTGAVAVLAFTTASHSTEGKWSFRGNPSWIDDVTPPGEQVAVLWPRVRGSGTGDGSDPLRLIWVSELMNRRVGTVNVFGASSDYLPTQRVALQGRRVVTGRGIALDADYVLTRCPMTLDAPLVTEAKMSGARLYATRGAVRLSSASRPC
jgi:hypothetical protein